jgi:peptidyl-dipeptidase A
MPIPLSVTSALRCCLLALAAWSAACASAPADARAARFLAGYEREYQRLYTEANLAEWESNTRIVEGDDSNARRTRAANEALARFVGSRHNENQARALLARRAELEPLQALQLERVLFNAGASPESKRAAVEERIAAETAQVERLYGYEYRLDGQPITVNAIDEGLRTERDLDRRLALWSASKEVGPGLRAGLIELRRLRNEVVRGLGYADFFAYRAAEYRMSTAELVEMVERLQRELRPLARELHTWMRYELARRYDQPVPDLLPAHWLPDRWGQDWSNLVDVPGLDLEGALQPKGAEWLVSQAERFYVSLGFQPLPQVFWDESSIYPLPADAGHSKNNHASAWHIDLAQGVRTLMSVEPNARWYETTHHELGHIYYDLAYSRPEVPLLLRTGANRAYHEAVGSLMGLASMQPRFVAAVGLSAAGPRPDPMQLLLKEALNYAVFIPWSAGTMLRFEQELYAEELPPERWNQRWWELVARYQGIAPPMPRGEEYCDAATKTHINDDPAEYYDYALSYVLLFQLHDHIAREILHEDPRDTCYYGRREVGDYLRSILEVGATQDGNELLVQRTGSQLSARAMVDYFEPLRLWLVEQNAGRKHTLGEI